LDFLQKISEEIFSRKYMISGESSPEEVIEKISSEIAAAENKSNFEQTKQIFYKTIIEKKLLPGGRILANARPEAKMKNYNNCFTIDIEDSMEGIYGSLREDAVISAQGGGVGFDISRLRPEGAKIKKGGESSGPISFLKVFDQSAKVIHTGGGRRCLPSTYSVQMFDKSWKKIYEITMGDQILFENNSYKINEAYKNGIQDLIKIYTENGYHISTPNHKWCVLNLETNKPEWIEAQNLYSGEIKFAFLSPKD